MFCCKRGKVGKFVFMVEKPIVVLHTMTIRIRSRSCARRYTLLAFVLLIFVCVHILLHILLSRMHHIRVLDCMPGWIIRFDAIVDHVFNCSIEGQIGKINTRVSSRFIGT